MEKKKIRFYIVLVIIWLLVIFIMSSFDASESGKQSSFFVNIISKVLNIDDVKLLSLIVRKMAHFTEYFILGLLVSNVISLINKKYYYAVIFGILYAISDEAHQIFVSGRVFQVRDILIDSLGLVCGIYLLYGVKNKIDNKW